MLAAATFSKEGQDDDRSSIIPVKISPPKNVGKVPLAPVPKGAIVLQSIPDAGNDSSSQNPQHYLANFLSCLLRLPTVDIGAALRKPLSLWPEHMLQQLSSRVHLEEAILSRIGENCYVQVMRSTIKDADLGLFEKSKMEKDDLLIEAFGVLVYLKQGTKIDGTLPNMRYGTDEVFVTRDELEKYGIFVDLPEKPDGADAVKMQWYRQRIKWDCYVVPYRFCPARFVNDSRVLNGVTFLNMNHPGLTPNLQIEQEVVSHGMIWVTDLCCLYL